MSMNVFVLPSSGKKQRAGERIPPARSSIQPDQVASTVSARSVGAWGAAGSRASDRLRCSADGVNSPRGGTSNEERCLTAPPPRSAAKYFHEPFLSPDTPAPGLSALFSKFMTLADIRP